MNKMGKVATFAVATMLMTGASSGALLAIDSNTNAASAITTNAPMSAAGYKKLGYKNIKWTSAYTYSGDTYAAKVIAYTAAFSIATTYLKLKKGQQVAADVANAIVALHTKHVYYKITEWNLNAKTPDGVPVTLANKKRVIIYTNSSRKTVKSDKTGTWWYLAGKGN